LRARQQPIRSPLIEINAAEKYPENKNKETREKANTIFNEVRQFAYVFRAREKKILLIQTTNTICTLYIIQEGSTPLFITRKTQGF